MSHIAIFGGSLESEILASLQGESWDLITSQDGAALLEAVVVRRPDAVVMALEENGHGDQHLRLLHFVRRAAPDVPLILIAGDGGLRLERDLREVRPHYYDVCPFDPANLKEAVRAAIERPARSARAGR